MPDIDFDFADAGATKSSAMLLKNTAGTTWRASSLSGQWPPKPPRCGTAAGPLGIAFDFCDRLAKLIPFGTHSVKRWINGNFEMCENYQIFTMQPTRKD